MAAEKISANAHAAGPASYFLEPMAPVGFNNSTSEDDSYGAEEEYVRRSRAAAAAKTTRGRAKKDTLHDPRYADDAFRPYREDTDDDSGAGDGPVLPLRAQRARKAKDVPKPYLGSSTAQKNGSVAPPTITRGDGQSSSVFPVIPEETASPAPVPVPARRTPMTHGRTYAPETRNALFVDDWTSPFGTARKWHNQNKMVSVGIAFVAIVTGLGYVVSRLGGSGSSPAGYVAPTEIPSSMEELTERVVIMESHLQGLATQFHDTTGDVRDLTDLVNKIKVDVHNVADRQKTQGSSIKVLEGDMAALKHRMDALENSIRATLDDGRLASALEKILPRSLPVRYHKGSLVIDPAFYTELKKVFVGEGEMEKRVRSLINLGVEAPGKGDQGWRIDKYQKELEGLTTRMFERLSSERNYDERFLQRDEFVELVRKELNMHRNDIKVTAGMLKGSQVTIKAANGQDMSPAIQSLIDAALLKYSKDTIGMPDYALFTAGARPIKDLTSDSVMIYKPSAVGQWLGYTGIGNGPQIALSADNSVGNCWSFNTGEGRLGIQLARPVVVTSISIDHASHDLTFSQTSAPKTVEVVSRHSSSIYYCGQELTQHSGHISPRSTRQRLRSTSSSGTAWLRRSSASPPPQKRRPRASSSPRSPTTPTSMRPSRRSPSPQTSLRQASTSNPSSCSSSPTGAASTRASTG
jgi:hypothetical protein